MKKYDNYIRSLSALQRANFDQADCGDIYI